MLEIFSAALVVAKVPGRVSQAFLVDQLRIWHNYEPAGRLKMTRRMKRRRNPRHRKSERNVLSRDTFLFGVTDYAPVWRNGGLIGSAVRVCPQHDESSAGFQKKEEHRGAVGETFGWISEYLFELLRLVLP